MTNVLKWRTVDIIVAAVLGVAFGVVFFAWNNMYGALEGVFAFYPPLRTLLYGMWLLPGVLGGLVIRKAGASVFTSTVAATVSVFFGAPTPLAIILYGAAQGALAEGVFAAFRYRRWDLKISLLAGAVAGIGPGIADPILWYPSYSNQFRLVYLVCTVASSTVVAGIGGWALVQMLRPTGVLAQFESGQSEQSGKAGEGSLAA